MHDRGTMCDIIRGERGCAVALLWLMHGPNCGLAIGPNLIDLVKLMQLALVISNSWPNLFKALLSPWQIVSKELTLYISPCLVLAENQNFAKCIPNSLSVNVCKSQCFQHQIQQKVLEYFLCLSFIL